MLEANTDRSYFTIGAIIIAAILIAGATFIFKDTLFGDTGLIVTSIKSVFEKATSAIGGIGL